MSLSQFFGYFGSKHGLSRRYPAPRHETIIEPFAGSAGYATRHHSRRVILVEKNPLVAGVWRYLLRASPREILALPDLEPGQGADELDVCPEARALIGFWLGYGDAAPRNLRSSWMKQHEPGSSWGRIVRARIASQLDKVRHWQLIEGDFSDAPDIEADWFVDPPYEVAGWKYPFHTIDYAELARWCGSRRGQVIVCEQSGATWLPFRPCFEMHTLANESSIEVIWTNGTEEEAQAASV